MTHTPGRNFDNNGVVTKEGHARLSGMPVCKCCGSYDTCSTHQMAPAILDALRALLDAMDEVNAPRGTDKACMAYGNAWSRAEDLIQSIEKGE